MLASPAQPTAKVTIKRGLEGQDNNIDLLQSYFKELKAVTVEPSPPDVDLLTFAICTHYFGVITMTQPQQHADDEDAEGEPEEDSLDAGYVASPPPPSPISSTTSFTSARSAVRFEPKDSTSKPGRSYIRPPSPEEEKVLKWREAFLAQLQEGDSEEEPLLSKGKMRDNQYIPEERLVPIPSTSNNLDDYINWPDDTSSDEYSGDHHVQGDQLDHETEAYSRLDGAEFTTVLGREILEPEQFDSPVGMTEIRPDPGLDAFMHAEAIKYQGILRAQRIKAYQDASASRPLFIQPEASGPKSTPIGIIYLASSQTVDDMHRGQLNIGIYVAPNYIEQPGLVQSVKEVVNEAFHDTSCHRVQAIVVDHKSKFDTLELYTSSGFSREGVGRREFFSPVTHEWKDVFYFAILATDWVVDNSNVSSSARPRPKTLWDDLLVCQQREREELLRMEEKTLKRSTSVETIRDKAAIAPSIASTSRSDTSSVANTSAATSSSSVRKGSPKRRRVEVGPNYVKGPSTRRPRAPSTSTSSIGSFDTMSTISSEWEIPARPAFAIPVSNGASPPNMGASTSSTGNWVMLD